MAALVAWTGVSTASADSHDDVIIVETSIPIITESGGQTQSIQLNIDGSLTFSQGIDLINVVKPQCIPAGPTVNETTLCMGYPSTVDPNQAPLVVGGLHDFLGSNQGEHLSALGWLLEEAVDAVSAIYDLPYDGRVGRYAGDQLRAYIVTRILDILDKSLYGEELTPDELRTLQYVNDHFLSVDERIAQWANDEYQSFQALGCGYSVPPAPSFVTQPVTMPKTVTDWCSHRPTHFDHTFVFAPPLPSADHFQAWALYRHWHELGLDTLSTPEMQEQLGDTYRAVLALGGMAAAAGGAIAAAAAIGGSVTAASFVAGAIGSASVVTTFGASLSSMAAAVTTVGAIAAASIVAVVVIAVVVTAIAIWQLVEYEQVGVTLRERLKTAQSAADAFGLDEIRDQFSSLPLREGMTADNLPPYRQSSSVARIVELVTAATSAKFTGVHVPDDTTLWVENETTEDDFRFIVTDTAGDSQIVDVLHIPVDGVDTTVRFSKGWMITDVGEGERAALEFGFVDTQGRKALATRAPASVGGFTVSTVQPDGALTSASTNTIEFLDSTGSPVTVSLLGQSTSGLGGPRPSAVGPLTPGRTVILRPNPVAIDGSFDLDRFVTGYDYLWGVLRYDVGSATWLPVTPTMEGYDARFIPDQVGSYRATVLMHDTDPFDGIDDDVWGVVEFDVSPPPVDVLKLELIDDGVDGLRVAAQVGAAVPQNDYTLTVQWPASVTGEPGGTASVDLVCHTIDALGCSTVDTENFPDLRTALSHTVAHDANTTSPVQVTITDRFGAGLTRTLAIDSPDRPRLDAPLVGPSPEQPGIVVFNRELTTVQVPVGVDANPNYELARITPGTGSAPTNFGIVDPADGLPYTSVEIVDGARVTANLDPVTNGWVLDLHVTAGVQDIGTHTVPLVVQQVTGARATLPLTIDFVAASGDRFRGAIAHDIDPLDFAVDPVPELIPYVIGGQDAWGEYDGDLCVTVQYRQFPSPPVERCAPVSSMLDAEGKLQPISFRDFVPDGLSTGTYSVTASIPEGEQTDSTPLGVSFLLRGGPPSIDLAWDETERAVLFDVTPFANPDVTPPVPPAAITGYECRLDGEPVECAGATGSWADPSLSDGVHIFELFVADERGNYASASVEFDSTPPLPEEPGNPPGKPDNPGKPPNTTGKPGNPGKPDNPGKPPNTPGRPW